MFITILIAISFSEFITIANGAAEVLVRFEYYSNPDGTLSNNHCCDGWPLRCQRNGGCDYYFRICLDEEGRPDNTKSCQYGYHRSNKVANDMASIVFADYGNSFGGLPNPLKFSVPEPVDGRNIVLKIDVKEEDHWTKSDYVDYFNQPILFFKGIYPKLHVPIELVSRTRLLTAITIQCAENWFGKECTVRCDSPGRNQHYHCDLWTGEKICKPGWSGQNCSDVKERARRGP